MCILHCAILYADCVPEWKDVALAIDWFYINLQIASLISESFMGNVTVRIASESRQAKAIV